MWLVAAVMDRKVSILLPRAFGRPVAQREQLAHRVSTVGDLASAEGSVIAMGLTVGLVPNGGSQLWVSPWASSLKERVTAVGGSHSRGSHRGLVPEGGSQLWILPCALSPRRCHRASHQKSSVCLTQRFSAMGTLSAGGHRTELQPFVVVTAGNGDWRLVERGQGTW